LNLFTLQESFAGLRVYHLEDGSWANRTFSRDFDTRTLCAQTSSLSPFAIGFFGPTSASVSVGGRVVTPNRQGISRVAVTLTGGDLAEPRRVYTNSFGRYRIDGLAAGRTYVLQAESSRYRFQTPDRVVTPVDDVSDEDFIADYP
jgi:hypothetical protein